VEKPVLLRQVWTEGQSDLDLASDNAREPCADRSHQSLRGETVADSLIEVRVSWFTHSLHRANGA
jgi:hypothetical protein